MEVCGRLHRLKRLNLEKGVRVSDLHCSQPPGGDQEELAAVLGAVISTKSLFISPPSLPAAESYRSTSRLGRPPESRPTETGR